MHRRPLLSALDRALEQLDHRLEPLARPCAFLLVARFGRTDAKTTWRQRGTVMGPSTEKMKASAKARAARVHFASSTSPTQSIPTGSYRLRQRAECGHEPPGHGGFGTGGGSVSAVVVTSANMRERAVFIGSTSVWDTIGTLPPAGIEIITLFSSVY